MASSNNKAFSDVISKLNKMSIDERLAYLRDLSPAQRAAYREAAREDEKRRCEESLYYFIKKAWPHLVPNEDFTPNWHIEAICEHLEAVADREIKRLIINIPPRHSKSTIVAVGFPAWLWLQNPGKRPNGAPYAVRPGTWRGPGTRFMFASYSQQLSSRDSTLTRSVITSDWYQGHWGDRVGVRKGESEKKKFANLAGGVRIATSVGGTVTGEGGDIICLDDPHSIGEVESDAMRGAVLDWFDMVLSTRLNNKEHGAIVVIMQRAHEADLCGHLLESQPGVWDHLCFPAEYERDHPYPTRSSLGYKDPRKEEGELLWPARETQETLEKTKLSLGRYGAAGQLQQRPAPQDGGMFDVDNIVILPEAPPEHELTNKIRGWDFASSEGNRAAYTVGIKWAYRPSSAQPFVILDVVRLRAAPAKVQRTFIMTANADGFDTAQDIPMDPGQAGKAQVANFNTLVRPGILVYASPEFGNKESRAAMLGAYVSDGKVSMVEADWNDDLKKEMGFFPNARFNDQIDASVRAFTRLNAMLDDLSAENTPAPVGVLNQRSRYY